MAAAKAAGHDATRVTLLGKAGVADWTLLRLALEADFVLVTNNAGDFRALSARRTSPGPDHHRSASRPKASNRTFSESLGGHRGAARCREHGSDCVGGWLGRL
ncbi:MAG: DUF5615 family PIN-like protein [Beijerinckiaceae bacterium]